MRLSPAINALLLATVCCVAFAAAPAFAQNAPARLGQPVQPGYQSAYNATQAGNQLGQMQQAFNRSANNNAILGMQPTTQPPSLFGQSKKQGMTQEEYDDAAKDHDSPEYKADQLAKQAKADGEFDHEINKKKDETKTVTDEEPTPPELEQLQNIKASHAASSDLFDGTLGKKMSLDLRRDSQREAALSYGARGGLAKRSYIIVERLKDYEPTFDKVFDFRALLLKAPSGLLIEPPIVHESLDALSIEDSGNEAAVADQILKINKQAKIVTAPRDWRTYLNFTYTVEIPPPPRVLWPKDEKEQDRWNAWVKQGWQAGYEQGWQIFESNLAQLTADYSGMVRYRTLLAEGKISQPYALQEDRGVTGGKNEMRVEIVRSGSRAPRNS